MTLFAPCRAPPDDAARSYPWVPIRALTARHRPRILTHLLSLGEADRYLRFGHPASDAQIARYVDHIDFTTDEVFGIFNRRLRVVAVAHLALLGDGRGAREAEFGGSVSAGARGRGWGARLFEIAVLHARNRGVDTLHIHALADNAAMLHIVRAAGAVVELDGRDALARLPLAADDVLSHLGALVEQQAAELDYSMKRHARRVDDWLATMNGAGRARPAPPGTQAPAPGETPPAADRAAGPPV
jgi:RimJ/RimL family protein N-acetyltransferase